MTTDYPDGPGATMKNVEGDSSMPLQSSSSNKEIDRIIYSDIGLVTLLDRLKQSIASVREFAAFSKKRAAIEDDHAKDVKRLAKSTQETMQRAESRRGTYLRQLHEALGTHDLMSDNGARFALELHQMHDDMTNLSNDLERARKTIKHEGMDAEKRATDAEAAAQRAKSKYDGFAEDYDRAKTGDIKGSRRIMKGPRSAAQHEEDLLKKLQAADADYAAKVQASRAQTAELRNSSRPRAVNALRDHVRECDAALSFQLQKYASINERLLLRNGLLVAPITTGGPQNSLASIMQGINNDEDLNNYILSQKSTLGPQAPELVYEEHPTLRTSAPVHNPASRQVSVPISMTQPQPQPQPQSQAPSEGFTVRPRQSQTQLPLPLPPVEQPGHSNPTPAYTTQKVLPPDPTSISTHAPRQPSGGAPPYPTPYPADNNISQPYSSYVPSHVEPSSHTYSINSQTMRLPSQTHPAPPSAQSYPTTIAPTSRMPQQPMHMSTPSDSQMRPPANPVFGIALADLYNREQTIVPRVVTTCIHAVELFGLNVEGIYRVGGSRSYVNQIKDMFNNDAARVDFRNPNAFFNDIHAVADVLKAFLREMPEPLIPHAFYNEFIAASRVEDNTKRRDSLHTQINELPDPCYATLRAVILHLNKVQQYVAENRMTTRNLALVFAPSLMGAHTRPQVGDPNAEASVIEAIVSHTLEIFDEDDGDGVA